MAEISLIPYTHNWYERWNSFIDNSNEGTIFHRLDFLDYHGERFKQQEHHLIWLKGQSLFAVMPMAVCLEKGQRLAFSPYGGSYGGPVFSKPLNYADSKLVVKSLIDYLVKLNVISCKLTLPTLCCYAQYSETFRLALLEYGFLCINREITSAVCIDINTPVSEQMTSRARNMARKASKGGVTIVCRGDVDDFWKVMDKTFQKHNACPTHTLSEFRWLCNKFPECVYVDVAYFEKKPIAGIGFFVINQRVNSTFYLCQDIEFQSLQAQSLLIYNSICNLRDSNFIWLDFGTSSYNMQGRQNLFFFKESFGSIGLFRDTYLWQK